MMVLQFWFDTPSPALSCNHKATLKLHFCWCTLWGTIRQHNASRAGPNSSGAGCWSAAPRRHSNMNIKSAWEEGGTLCPPPPSLAPKNLKFPGKLRFWSKTSNPELPCNHKATLKIHFCWCPRWENPPPAPPACCIQYILLMQHTLYTWACNNAFARCRHQQPKPYPIVPKCSPGRQLHYLMKHLLSHYGRKPHVSCAIACFAVVQKKVLVYEKTILYEQKLT